MNIIVPAELAAIVPKDAIGTWLQGERRIWILRLGSAERHSCDKCGLIADAATIYVHICERGQPLMTGQHLRYSGDNFLMADSMENWWESRYF